MAVDEILVHVSAPSSKKDDDRYRALALAYDDFEPVETHRLTTRNGESSNPSQALHKHARNVIDPSQDVSPAKSPLMQQYDTVRKRQIQQMVPRSEDVHKPAMKTKYPSSNGPVQYIEETPLAAAILESQLFTSSLAGMIEASPLGQRMVKKRQYEKDSETSRSPPNKRLKPLENSEEQSSSLEKAQRPLVESSPPLLESERQKPPFQSSNRSQMDQRRSPTPHPDAPQKSEAALLAVADSFDAPPASGSASPVAADSLDASGSAPLAASGSSNAPPASGSTPPAVSDASPTSESAPLATTEPQPQPLSSAQPVPPSSQDVSSIKHGDSGTTPSLLSATDVTAISKPRQPTQAEAEGRQFLENLPPFDWVEAPAATPAMSRPDKSHVTPLFKDMFENPRLQHVLDTLHFVRPLDNLERVIWRIDINDEWSAELQMRFWQELTEFIARGSGGRGINCYRRKTDEAPNGLGRVTVSCHGEVARHVYLLIWVSSRSYAKRSSPKCVEATKDEEIVIQVV